MGDTYKLKPLGRKAYGSIGHLPNSRIGPGDHHIHAGQGVICCEKTRDRHDRVIVTEKVDGSCTAVARVDGVIVPLGRAGWPAATSKFEQHQLFHQWVMEQQDRFLSVLKDGERLVGEWLAQAHGTRYGLPHEPWVVFDLMIGAKRLPYDCMKATAEIGGFITPRLISDGPPFSVYETLCVLEPSGHGAVDPVEGAVWRVERKGIFDFIAKWVRPDKVDGSYLPEMSGREAIWNWRPKG